MQLFRKYAPKTFDEVVGQERIIAAIERKRQSDGLAGNVFLLTGGSGTGKTSIANLIARDIADEMNIEELDAKGLTGSAVLTMERSLATFGMGEKTGRAVIVNEIHGLRKDAIHQLLTTLERVPRHVSWIFTTTVDGQETLWEDCQDAGPLISRCIPYALAQRGLSKPFADRAFAIATIERLTDKPVKAFERLAADCRNNLRMMLSAIESGAMLN